MNHTKPEPKLSKRARAEAEMNQMSPTRNPFAEKANWNPASIKKEVAAPADKLSKPAFSQRPLSPPTTTRPTNLVHLGAPPGMYVAASSKAMILKAIENGEFKEEEFLEIFRIAGFLANTIGQTTPTQSDYETAMKLRTIENLYKVAKGEMTIDIVRLDVSTREPLDKRMLTMYWKRTAEAAISFLEEETKNFTSGVDVPK